MKIFLQIAYEHFANKSSQIVVFVAASDTENHAEYYVCFLTASVLQGVCHL